MISIDTNVLARYFLRDVPSQIDPTERLLAELTPDRPGFVTMTAVSELYFVLRRNAGLDKTTCLDVFDELVRMPQLEFDDGETVVEAIGLARDGADFGDALIHGTGQLYAVSETVTFDRDAARLLGWRDLAESSYDGRCR